MVSTIILKSEIERLIEQNHLVKANGESWSLEGDASTIAALIALQKLVKQRRVKHVVSFHSSIARAKEFMHLANESRLEDDRCSKLTAYHVSGKDGAGERAVQIDRFLGVEPSLITNARCLTEGVDVPAIDAILFADPKQSKVDIVQAAGRALRRFNGKDFGYIIIPVVIEDNPETQISSAFGQIITVISALAMNDERIVEEFKSIVACEQNTQQIVEFDIPIMAEKIEFNELLQNIEIQIWDRLSFAQSVKGESDFTRWMRDSTKLSDKSIRNYTQAIRKISNDLVRMKLTYSSLDEIMKSEDLKRLKDEYFSIPEHKELDVRGKSMYSAGFNKLIDYHRSEKLNN